MIFAASNDAHGGTTPEMNMSAPLDGRNILVVEDEAIVSMLIEDMLLDLGARATCTGSVSSALASIGDETPDAAVLDVNLGRETTFPVAERLAAAGVPFVFSTGYGGTAIPSQWADRPIVQKPYVIEDLCKALVAAMSRDA